MMIAYHGKQEIKDRYLARVEAHRRADELIAGTGWENGKGCAVGCTLDAYDHKLYETELGIPEVIAHLEDRLFEGLHTHESTRARAQQWPAEFLEAIAPGTDLSLVWPKFAAWLLLENAERCGDAWPEQRDACRRIAELFIVWVKTGVRPEAESSAWESAAAAARSAVAAAAEAAWSAHACMADKLLELLREAE